MAAPSLGQFITALTAAAAAALPDVKVVDGPVVSNTSTPQWLFVGANDTPGEPGASTSDGAAGALPQFVVARTLAVDCTIQAWHGTTDIAARRAEAEAILDALEQLLEPDPAGVTLGLSGLAWARLGSVDYTPVQLPAGATVTLVATISAQCRTATR